MFLFYSVNQSRHFQGIAKMIGPVNHQMHHVDLWANASKWPGSIPLEWVEVKDIHNNQFIHIENPLNENKPVCQGRDC